MFFSVVFAVLASSSSSSSEVGLHRIVGKGHWDRIDTIVAGGGETREGRKERAAIDRRVPEGEAKTAALTADPLARCRS